MLLVDIRHVLNPSLRSYVMSYWGPKPEITILVYPDCALLKLIEQFTARLASSPGISPLCT
jgi:hypothetical protein